MSAGTPGATAYRVFQQGATRFVSIQSVRETAEQRATEFCDRKGKAMESLTETTATPPYILGNFPRVEIVLDCIDKPGSPPPGSGDDKSLREPAVRAAEGFAGERLSLSFLMTRLRAREALSNVVRRSAA